MMGMERPAGLTNQEIIAGVRAELARTEADFGQMIAALDEATLLLTRAGDAVERACAHAARIDGNNLYRVDDLLRRVRAVRDAIETEAHPF